AQMGPALGGEGTINNATRAGLPESRAGGSTVLKPGRVSAGWAITTFERPKSAMPAAAEIPQTTRRIAAMAALIGRAPP
uniref:hypothetical protein n=1 Tax=Escherichia coli TaxID=562 RepID=UPI001953D238